MKARSCSRDSGLDVITADDLDDAAAKIVKAVGNKSSARPAKEAYELTRCPS